ncbi:uncharacterized protein BDW43DRAFT_282848 [Aspergillus alliaceus]|uniref:uncharacterized protein n=1 Tax=Petromyces alliaceus TaxID=209559 RepID=UPI0012A5C90E|nr:uncharacterized protein BDW43DRAFT_282848 [Aspergillus alliaceus]KAB8231366.1 hypothetical protein BDW43DRAFT_282848 [Aspergillus alliaceus]
MDSYLFSRFFGPLPPVLARLETPCLGIACGLLHENVNSGLGQVYPCIRNGRGINTINPRFCCPA